MCPALHADRPKVVTFDNRVRQKLTLSVVFGNRRPKVTGMTRTGWIELNFVAANTAHSLLTLTRNVSGLESKVTFGCRSYSREYYSKFFLKFCCKRGKNVQKQTFSFHFAHCNYFHKAAHKLFWPRLSFPPPPLYPPPSLSRFLSLFYLDN